MLPAALMPWVIARAPTRFDKAVALSVVMGLSVLTLSGLGMQFCRRRLALAPWLRSLPSPTRRWWAYDVGGLILLGLAPSLAVVAGMAVTKALDSVNLAGVLLGHLLLLSIVSVLSASYPRLSFGWLAIIFALWMGVLFHVLAVV